MRTFFSLDGRRALVTGSSRGIGAAMAKGLAGAGADVAIHCAGRRAAAEQVAADIEQKGGKAMVVAQDLAVADAAERILNDVIGGLGGLDILVLNASIQIAVPWADVTPEQVDRHIRINFQRSFELIQKAAPPMLERGWGRILTVGSVQEAKPHPDMIIYAALKSAQTMMVRNFAKQFAPWGVTVNNVAPGIILTDRNRERLADSAYRDRALSSVPAGYFGQAEDCVGAALLLCAEAGRYITGQCLFVDGGMSL